ncbi:hypothetical protein QJS10_CPA01g01422 [Acorus calamus]|uniref:Uncharacterized protein n=1 Tax=Acorus calamus TaxID=4465 RepID=A0AAV9FKT1_ACOCL|nr:hypothetical protein QJS10_CPA01g01422 [Acorus calamus]
MGRLQNKLRRLQEPLRRWNRHVIGDLPSRVAQAQKHVQFLIAQDQGNITNIKYSSQLKTALSTFSDLQSQLETFWAQRSRLQWVREEVISGMLRKAQCEGRICGYQPDIRLNGQLVPPGLTHVMYADDLLIVSTATPTQCKEIKQVMEETRRLTGLIVNWQKSSIRFSPSVPQRFTRWMSRILRVQIAPYAWKYLGLPIGGHNLNKQRRLAIMDVVSRRLQGWKGQLLSLAGRTILIQSVMNALPQHFMLSAAMPMTAMRDVEKAARSFLWNGYESSYKIHLISWEAVTRDKANGGLGLRRLSIMREAMLGFIIRTEPPRGHNSGKSTWCWDGSTAKTPKVRDVYAVWQPQVQVSQTKEWKYIWALPLYPKVKNFLWKLCWERLPTKSHLDSIVWKDCQDPISCQAFLALILYHLWKSRNDWIFRKITPQPRVIATRALTQTKECVFSLTTNSDKFDWLNSIVTPKNSPPQPNCVKGLRKQYGEIILLTDGSVDLPNRGAGAGFVVVNPRPFQILGAGFAGWPWATPLRMEAEAMRIGLRFVEGLGITKLHICSDSLSLIQVILSGGPGPSQIHDVVEEFHRWQRSPKHLAFSKVPREMVLAPEALAKYARGRVESMCLRCSRSGPLQSGSVGLLPHSPLRNPPFHPNCASRCCTCDSITAVRLTRQSLSNLSDAVWDPVHDLPEVGFPLKCLMGCPHDKRQ